MNSSIPKLISLLMQLDGFDVAAMSPEAYIEFRAGVLDRFTQATVGLPELFLDERVAEQSWLWRTELTPPSGGPEIADFMLMTTDHIEAALTMSMLREHFACVCPARRLTLGLWGEYRGPAPRGLNEIPHLQLAITLASDQDLSLLKHMAIEADLQLSQRRYGMNLTVLPTEDCCEAFVNPPSVARAIAVIADSKKRVRGSDQVQLLLDVEHTANPYDVQLLFRILGALFRGGIPCT